MGLFDEDLPKKSGQPQITVGEDLSNLSEQDLAERITALELEIQRTKETLSTRNNIRVAAESLFGNSS